MIAPETVFLSADTKFGKDVTIEPNVVFGPGVTVEDGAMHPRLLASGRRACRQGRARRAFCAAAAGRRSRRRRAHRQFRRGEGGRRSRPAPRPITSPISATARVGAGANIGAGTITCNYDGVAKHRTDIGKGAFIGSNSSLVAPVKIGDGAYIGSGSVITQDVPADALALERSAQTIKDGWAKRLRQVQAMGKKRPKTARLSAVTRRNAI